MIRNKESLTSSRYFISIERSIFNGRVATSNECKSDFQLVEPGVDVINALNWVAESIYNFTCRLHTYIFLIIWFCYLDGIGI